MLKIIVTLLILASSGSAIATLLGPIKSEPDESCGCFLRGPDKKDGLYYFDGKGEEEKSLFNINGKDQLVACKKFQGPAEKVGKKLETTCEAGKVKIKIIWTVSAVCKEGECEQTSFHAEMTANKAKQDQKVQLTGSCGCS